ncbi:uncharacterized protein VTP21DRAFT_151 [Calcarisporiella thermophila]|uniref:uncharacterized protein n=1 Tax=Calcarisporiella thermophila TaxID=911321 RepID=UPI0037427992
MLVRLGYFAVIASLVFFGQVSQARSNDQRPFRLEQCPLTEIKQSFLNYLRGCLSDDARIVLKGEGNYKAINEHWSDLAELNATAIVQPANVRDVQQVIDFVKHYNIDFAIKSGGHNCNPSHSGSEGGLLLDLGLLNSIEYSTKSKTVALGPGARWGDVDKHLAKFGRAAVGGRVSNVGVGGFTLGGGYGWKTGQHGLASDNLVEVEMVIADGRSLRVSKTEHPDLFFAIRGGGGQFGVATKFTFETFEQNGKIFSGFLFYRSGQIKPLAKLVANWSANNKDPKANLLLVFARPPPSFEPTSVVQVWYDGNAEQARKVFKDFYDLGAFQDTTEEMEYWKGNTLQDPLTTTGDLKFLSAVSASKITPDLVETAFDYYTEFTDAIPDAVQTTILIEPTFQGAFRGVKDADSAYPHSKANHIVGIVPRWKDHKLTGKVLRWIRKGEVILRKGNEANALYPNYSIYDEPVEHLFRGNLARLQNIKRAYDEECLFRHGFIIPTDACTRCPVGV